MSLHPLARNVDHPAPLRDRAPGWLVLAGLFAAPLAWSLQLVVSYLLVGDRCSGPPGLLATTILFATGASAVAVAILGLGSSYRVWRLTRNEKRGDRHEALTAGAGRTRFLSLCGLIASTLFLAAALFELLVPFLGSPCPAT